MRNNNGKKGQNGYYDYNLIAVIILLTCFGLVMLYSTSSYTAQVNYEGDSLYFFRKQAGISAVSFAGMLVVSAIDYRFWKKLATLAYIGAIGLILLVIPFGKTTKGAARWIVIPGINQQLQPAEFAKVAVIVFISYLLCKMGKRIRNLKGVLLIMFMGGIIAAMILFITRNMSTAIIIMGITVILIFVVHPKTWPFMTVGIAGGGIAGAAIYYLKNFGAMGGNFRLQRVMAWLRPEEYASDESFQVLQGLYAIGSGGFFGKGLGNSTQKIGWIPEVQNDFIFPVICEELGVFGALMVTILFGFLLYRLLFIARNAPDLFGSLLVTGIFAHIALQVIFNIAVVLGVMPATGITLPFISYGGTSILFLMAEMGLALSVSKRITFQEEE